jgi:serine phosphatase RsbU (regulator of sigma subunit)
VLSLAERSSTLMTPQFGILSRTPGRILAARTSGDLRDLLGKVVRGLYPGCSRFELYIGDCEGGLVPVEEGGEARPGDGRQLLASLRTRLVMSRRELGEARAFPASHDFRRGALMFAPLLDAEELVGLIVLEGGANVLEFAQQELSVLEGIAALFSLAVQRLRLRETRLQQARLARDLKAACLVQRRFMSEGLPPGIGVTAHPEYLPAFEVGGDFYGLTCLGEKKVGVTIGDVSGQGISAALVMSRVASEAQRVLASGAAPRAALKAAEASISQVGSETFVTASCLWLDAGTRRLTVANAGHPPLVLRRASGEVFTFGEPTGTPLGVEPSEYDEEGLDLEVSDILVLMTDGLLQALDPPSGGTGMERLKDLIRKSDHDPQLINARIHSAVTEGRSHALLDDVTWITLQVA